MQCSPPGRSTASSVPFGRSCLDHQLPNETNPQIDTPFDELAAPDPNREDILYADITSSDAEGIYKD